MPIVNVLEQLVRGYMCGSNTNRWLNHLFKYKSKKNQKNVKTYFYQFEFQDRGTVHLHMLVWLKDLTKMKLDAIRADIPWSNKLLAEQVLNLQPSEKPGVPLFQEATKVSDHNGKQILQLFHPSEAFAINLRAYISTILPLQVKHLLFYTVFAQHYKLNTKFYVQHLQACCLVLIIQ